MIIQKHTLFILILMLLVSCERYDDVEVDIPYKPKIVTTCLVQSGSNQLQVAVTLSQPVFNRETTPGAENSPTYITDAIVTIQQGSNTYTLVYDENENLYLFDLPSPILAGQAYDLTVTAGDKQSTGFTTIPSKANTHTTLQFDSVLLYDETYQYIARASTKLLDPGKQYLDFYPVIVYSDSSRSLMYTEGGTTTTLTEVKQGQTVHKTFLPQEIKDPGIYPERLELIVVNCDEGYGKNILSITNLFGGISLSPFSDPAITYSNMKGGIGIIGSYNPETIYYFQLR
jgi:hypothetical protein